MDFNSRYYLLESVQQVVDAIGSNCVLSGLDVSTIVIFNNTLFVTLTKGKLICDSTLIDFPDDVVLPLDLGSLPSQGRIILSVNYRYLRTSRPNFASISLKYLNNNGICTEWFPENDKIVLSLITYDKDNNLTSQQSSGIVDKIVTNINGKEYEIHPYNYTIQQLRPMLTQILVTQF